MIKRLAAVYGDSRSRNCGNGGVSENYGYGFWVGLLSSQRLSFRTTVNFGVGGDTTADMLARLTAVGKSDAEVVMLLGGTNDRVSMTARETIENLETIISSLLTNGKKIILIAETPRGNTTQTTYLLTPARLFEQYKVRNWCIEQASRPGVYVVDPWGELSDANGELKADCSVEGLHFNTNGAYFLGKAINDQAVRFIYEDAPPIPSDFINTNPLLIGTGGSVGTGGSGSLATGYSGSATSSASGLTRTYSKTVGDAQQIVIGGTASGTSPSLDLMRITGIQAGLTAGDKIEAWCALSLAAGQSNVLSLQVGFQVTNADTSVTYVWDGDKYDTNSKMPTVALQGVLRTEPMVVPVGATDIRLVLRAYTADTAAAAATITVTSLGYRKVTE